MIILRKRLKYTRLSKRGASKVFENGEMGIILWTTNRGSVGVKGTLVNMVNTMIKSMSYLLAD